MVFSSFTTTLRCTIYLTDPKRAFYTRLMFYWGTCLLTSIIGFEFIWITGILVPNGISFLWNTYLFLSQALASFSLKLLRPPWLFEESISDWKTALFLLFLPLIFYCGNLLSILFLRMTSLRWWLSPLMYPSISLKICSAVSRFPCK